MERLFQRLKIMANEPGEKILDYLYNKDSEVNKHVHKNDPFVLRSPEKTSVRIPIVQIKKGKM